MNNPLANKGFFTDLGDHHLSFFGKDDDIINIATIHDVFIATHTGADKAFLTVDV